MYLSFGYSCSSFLHNWPTIFISIIHAACKNLYLGQPYHQNLVVSRFVSKLSKHSYLRKPQQVIRNGNYILRFSEKNTKTVPEDLLDHSDSTSPFTPETSRTEEAVPLLLPLYWGRNFLWGLGVVEEERESCGCLVLVLPPSLFFLVQ